MIVPLIPIAILIDDRCQDLSYAYTMPDNVSWGHEKQSGTVRMATTKKWKKSFNDTHRTSCRVGWSSGLGALDTNPPSWIFTSSFIAYCQNIDSPESFILPFFTGRVNTLTFSEAGYTLSWSQNDQTTNIW